MRLPRIYGGRGQKPIAVGRHQSRDEEQIAPLNRLRLMTECGRDAGVDVPFAGGAARLRCDHVDLDLAVKGASPCSMHGMIDTVGPAAPKCLVHAALKAE